MNVTEAKMVKAFKEGRNTKCGLKVVWECGHFVDMYCNRDEIRGGKYLLWGTVIAEKKRRRTIARREGWSLEYRIDSEPDTRDSFRIRPSVLLDTKRRDVLERRRAI